MLCDSVGVDGCGVGNFAVPSTQPPGTEPMGLVEEDKTVLVDDVDGLLSLCEDIWRNENGCGFSSRVSGYGT